MPKLCFIDTETTGPDPHECHLVEIGALFSDGSEYEALIDPQREIPPEASAVHNISNRMVKGKPTAEEVRPEFLSTTWEVETFVAHNAPFDRSVLLRHFPGMKEAPWIDTLRWARHIFAGLPSYKLQALRYRFDLAPDDMDAHRALADVYVLKTLFDHLMAETIKIGTFTTEKLIEAIEKPLFIHTFYFGKCSGRPVEEVYREDWQYCKWLIRQPWFLVEHRDLYFTLTHLAMGHSLDQKVQAFV